ncbi:MAG: MurR/RpiR family transcriptional regulator [Candidatus Competibacterales bacterium]|nr:MurR/RpiR family transcriptional regulator [Candidatus Competibacterales bacterium]
MLIAIDRQKIRLRRSERKVADQVLMHPEQTIRASLKTLAEAAGVSTPTVMRFCQALGCDGFQDFKLRLAQSLAATTPPDFQRQLVSSPWRNDAGPLGFFDQAVTVLLSARSRLDGAALERAADWLAKATRIEIFALDDATLTAADAQHQLLALGLSAYVHSDSQTQHRAAAKLERGTVVLAIVSEGCESMITDSLTAIPSQTPVVLVAPSNGAIYRRETLVLGVPLPRISAESQALVRIAHAALIGALSRSLATRLR